MEKQCRSPLIFSPMKMILVPKNFIFPESELQKAFRKFRKSLRPPQDVKIKFDSPDKIEWNCRGFLGYKK